MTQLQDKIQALQIEAREAKGKADEEKQVLVKQVGHPG